jgi:hypothetical protein
MFVILIVLTLEVGALICWIFWGARRLRLKGIFYWMATAFLLLLLSLASGLLLRI